MECSILLERGWKNGRKDRMLNTMSLKRQGWEAGDNNIDFYMGQQNWSSNNTLPLPIEWPISNKLQKQVPALFRLG